MIRSLVSAIEITDGRSAPRYLVLRELPAAFASYAVTVVNVSAAGLLIEHAQPIRIGSTGRFSIQLPGAVSPVLQARVIWSRLGSNLNLEGKALYRSGLLSVDDGQLGIVIERLLGSKLAEEDSDSLERKRHSILEKLHKRKTQGGMKVVPSPALLDPDQVLMVQHAVEQLRVHPDEATKWYNRAKFSGGEGGEGPYREEVLAVWEYLERSVPHEAIRQVLENR